MRKKDASWSEFHRDTLGKLAHSHSDTSFSQHPGHGDHHRTAREHPLSGGTKLSAGQIPDPARDKIRVIK